MATIRDIRRLAFQALFQIDARGEQDLEDIRAALAGESDGLTPEEIDRAIEWATRAYGARSAADREFEALAPTWPAHRLAAVDRAILRLAHFEMTTGRTAPKVAVNEAIELAKHYSTDRSPAFVNGLLDKVLKRVQAESAAVQEPPAVPPRA